MDVAMRENVELGNSAEIKVVGVGGGGCNAVNRMIDVGIEGVEFVALNTDAGSLRKSKAPMRMCIGYELTHGLGSGGDPTLGKKAAEESAEDIEEVLRGADMVFVTAGMGGGTGTGAAPIVSQIALDLGALTVAVVTKPFKFEGKKRMGVAVEGIKTLGECADTMMVVPNDRLLQILDKGASMHDAFEAADDALRQGVQGIAMVICTVGLINVDFQDLRSIMRQGGRTMMATGRAEGKTRAADAAKLAVYSKLLDMSIEGAKRVLYNVSGPADMTLRETNEIGDTIAKLADPDANIIAGLDTDEDVDDAISITLVATGLDGRGRRSVQELERDTEAGSSRAGRSEETEGSSTRPSRENSFLDFL